MSWTLKRVTKIDSHFVGLSEYTTITFDTCVGCSGEIVRVIIKNHTVEEEKHNKNIIRNKLR